MATTNHPLKFWNVNSLEHKSKLSSLFPTAEFVENAHEADILLNPQDLADPTFPNADAETLFSAFLHLSPAYSVLHDHVSSFHFLEMAITRGGIEHVKTSPYCEFSNFEDYFAFKEQHPDTVFELIYGLYAQETFLGEGTLEELEENFPNEFNSDCMVNVVFPDTGRYFVRIANAKQKQGFTRSAGYCGIFNGEMIEVAEHYIPKRLRNALIMMLAPHSGFFTIEFFEEDSIHKIHSVKWGLRTSHLQDWFWETEASKPVVAQYNVANPGGYPMVGYEGEVTTNG